MNSQLQLSVFSVLCLAALAPSAALTPGKVIVVGSHNQDLITSGARIPRPGETVLHETFSQAFGGKGANQAVQAALLGAVLESHNFTEHAARLFCGCWLPNGDETFVELVCSSCGWYGEALQALGAVLFHEYDWDMFQVAVVVTRISNSPVNYPSCAQRVIDFGHAT